MVSSGIPVEISGKNLVVLPLFSTDQGSHTPFLGVGPVPIESGKLGCFY